MLIPALVIFFILTLRVFTMETNLVSHGKINPANQHAKHFVQSDRAEVTAELTFYFHIKENNREKLTSILNDISNPSSPNYGKHLTKEELDDLVRNKEGETIVYDFLTKVGAAILSRSSNGLRIEAAGTVQIWESALKCIFFHYRNDDGDNLIRTPEYFVPESVAEQVQLISNIVDFPVPIRHGPIISKGLHF